MVDGVSINKDFYSYYSMPDNLFSFYGELSHKNITMLLKLIKNTIALKTNEVIAKKSYTLLNESLENIINHNSNPSFLNAFVQLKLIENSLSIHVISPILKHDADLLKNKVTKLKALNEADLKQHYFDCITQTELTKKTAGLGLIQIAMITKNNFAVNFHSHENNQLLYELKLELIK